MKREITRSQSPTKKNSFVGTNEYITPEVLNGSSPSCAIDLWSLGVIVYKMYAGVTPFKADNEMELYENICKGKYSRHPSIPEDAWAFIQALLQVDPRERLGCSPVFNSINYQKIKDHFYFKGLDFDHLKFNTPVTEELEMIEEVDNTHGRISMGSFAVPCPMDDDEDDFYENFFTNDGQECNTPGLPKSYSEIKKKATSHNNLSMYLKDNHFEEKQRKHSLKCETKSYGIPVLFDEESHVTFTSTKGSMSPLILNN